MIYFEELTQMCSLPRGYSFIKYVHTQLLYNIYKTFPVNHFVNIENYAYTKRKE